MKRNIFIGDVHGCIEELEFLLDKVQFKPTRDRIFFVGDLINRGPHSFEVYKKFKSLSAQMVLGNHEYFFSRFIREKMKNHFHFTQLTKEFGSALPGFLDDMSKQPLFYEEDDFIVVHAGMLPGIPLNKSSAEQLTTIRTWDGTGENLQDKNNPPWFSFYQGSKKIIFGHWASLEGVREKNIIGLDTGCVYGKKLSALVLPENEIVSVKAKQVYCAINSSA